MSPKPSRTPETKSATLESYKLPSAAPKKALMCGFFRVYYVAFWDILPEAPLLFRGF